MALARFQCLRCTSLLESAKWRHISWRKGTKERLTARFAAVGLRVADGMPQGIGFAGKRALFERREEI